MHLKDMLVSIKSVFGLSFMNHVMIGFTRWDYTKRASILRRGITKEKLSSDVNRLLRDIVGHQHECPCIFLDNTLNLCTDDELLELYGDELPAITSSLDEALDAIYQNTCIKTDVFHCSGIESTLAERDVGRDMIEREEAAHTEGAKTFERLQKCWDGLGIEDPVEFLNMLEEHAQKERKHLMHFLAATTKPDLEHVGQSVQNSFDTKVAAEMKTSSWKNGQAASSFNRSLRMELVATYVDFIVQRSKGPADSQNARFEEVLERDRELILRYVCNCKGGSLSWGTFAVLQENLRWEQLAARETIFGSSCNVDKSIREFLKDANGLIAFLGNEPVPDWISKLSRKPTG